MAACHDEGDRFMAAFQSALKKDGVPERALADRLFTLAHRMLSATVEVDPSVLKDDEELRRRRRSRTRRRWRRRLAPCYGSSGT